MFAGTIVALVRWPAIGFLGAMFFLTLAPTSSVVPIASEVGAERRMYLPLAALTVLAVTLGSLLLDRLRKRWPARSRTLTIAAVAMSAAVVAALGVRTMLRTREYATPVALWESSVARRPNGRARFSLATEYISAGRHDEAIAQLREAINDYPDARAGLGTELAMQGRPAEALELLESIGQLEPGLHQLIRIGFRTLGLQTYLTAGQLKAISRSIGVPRARAWGSPHAFRQLPLPEQGRSRRPPLRREALRCNLADARPITSLVTPVTQPAGT